MLMNLNLVPMSNIISKPEGRKKVYQIKVKIYFFLHF